MQTVDDDYLAREVAPAGHRIAMGRGSQCCALTNFDIYRRMLEEDLPAALILQDDVELSPDIGAFTASLGWLPEGIELVQFEKYGRKQSRRLAGPALGTLPVSGRSLHRLYSRTAGAACYLLTRRGAERILNGKPVLDMPIDHFLFSPNVSPLFNQLGVAIVRPALARQKEHHLGSDIVGERRKRRKSTAGRLRRLWQEVNHTPAQLAATARGARWLDFNYEPGRDLK
jgi:glycosyl transferase family 25